MTFNKWLDTFVEEKGLDIETRFTVDGPSGENSIPLGCVVEAIKSAPKCEQVAIKNALVYLDFKNADVTDYFRHLSQALAI